MTDEEVAEKLAEWRQGDYAKDVGGHLFVDVAGSDLEDEEPYDVRETAEEAIGLVVVSQTCDVVRYRGEADTVIVCPLVRRNNSVSEASRGRRPRESILQHPPDDRTVVDLSRMMTVSKALLATWTRHEGFTDDGRRNRFAAGLERLFGRFAFPDDFNVAIKPLYDKVRKRHDKGGESLPGKVYRSLYQIRARAGPSWDAENVEVALICILQPEPDRWEADRKEIIAELETTLDKVIWPDGYIWASGRFVLGTVDELPVREWVESQALDFEYLSIARSA